MTQSDLPAVRQLARNDAFSFTKHAYDQMNTRDISYDDVKAILISPTNQIVECQPPSNTPGKEHTHERILLYDPCGAKDTIIVFVVLLAPTPDLRVITVENVDNTIWERKVGVPCLARK